MAALAAGGFLAAPAIAQGLQTPARFAVKPRVEIGLGNNACTGKSPIDANNRSNRYGVDFGYIFHTNGKISWGANIGLGVTTNSLKLTSAPTEYSYQAGPEADMDGDSYIRHSRVSALTEKVNATYLSIPVYADFRYIFSNRVALYALAGFDFGFKTSSKVASLSGEVDSWGVYPVYDNLVIAEEWLNCFGPRDLTTDEAVSPKASGFDASVIVGAGVEVWLGGPVSLNLGFSYQGGFSDIFKKTGSVATLPVSYTVADGLIAAPLTDGLEKCHLSRFSLSAGLTFRF